MSEEISFKLPIGLRILVQETCSECRKKNRFCGTYGKQKVCLEIKEDLESANGIAIEMKPSCELKTYISVSETALIPITEVV